MCRVRVYKPHTTEDCPLKAAAYCSHCACTGFHFTKDCPNAPLRRRKDMPVVQGRPAAEPANPLILNHNIDCIYSFLKLWGMDIPRNQYSEKTLKKFLLKEALKHDYTSVIYV